MTRDEILMPMLQACKSTLEREGSCHNMTCFAVGDEPVLTVVHSYFLPLGDEAKYRLTTIVGAMGRAVHADLAVNVLDMYVTTRPLDVSPEEREAWAAERPRNDPQRTEALVAMTYSLAGPQGQRIYPYGRDDQGRIVWHETEHDWVQLGGDLSDAFMHGFAGGPQMPLYLLPGIAAPYAGFLTLVPLTAATEAALRPPEEGN